MFEKPFSFEGRIRRSEYGISFIIYVVLSTMLSLFAEESGEAGIFINLIFIIPLLWFFWAQGAKRCHDLGNSGWYQIIPFYALWMIFQDGKKGVNKYGENPKEINAIGAPTNYSGTSGSSSPPPIVNKPGSYSGGYNGGHNNHENSQSITPAPTSGPTTSNGEGYKNGDLYN